MLATVRLGLQPGEFSTSAGLAQIDQPLVIANLADPIDQDRRESGSACTLHLLPDGGSVDLTEFVLGNLPQNSTVDATGAGVTRNERENEIKDRCNQG